MFVKHEIAFDATVGNFSVLVLFDCLKVPTTLTIHEFSPLLLAVRWRCNMDGHQGSGTVADGCSRDLAVRWGGCWRGKGSRLLRCKCVTLAFYAASAVCCQTFHWWGINDDPVGWENPLRSGSLVDRRCSSGKSSRLMARNSQGTLVKGEGEKKRAAVWHRHKYMPCDHVIQRLIKAVTVDVRLAVCSLYQNQVVFSLRSLMPVFDLSEYPPVFFPTTRTHAANRGNI